MLVSFYSYKGGVGRTQLLANAASYLCFYKSRKILLLEWDLEAPGLHYYFGKKNKDIKKDGLIETLNEYMELSAKEPKVPREKLPKFTEKNIVKNLITSKDGQGRVDLIPCANYSKDDYTQKINDFDWREFTERRDGNAFIYFLKENLEELDYDLVFIDSRTGIADYSGICNILLPDTNVIVMAPTEQNFEGALKITKAIAEHPYVTEGHRKPFILPVLSRIDESNDKFYYWLERFAEEFEFALLPSLATDEVEVYKERKINIFQDFYIPKTVLKYNRVFSTGENLLFKVEAQKITEIDLSIAYANVGKMIDMVYKIGYVDLTFPKEYEPELAFPVERKEKYLRMLMEGKVVRLLKLLELEENFTITEQTIFQHLKRQVITLRDTYEKAQLIRDLEDFIEDL